MQLTGSMGHSPSSDRLPLLIVWVSFLGRSRGSIHDGVDDPGCEDGGNSEADDSDDCVDHVGQ